MGDVNTHVDIEGVAGMQLLKLSWHTLADKGFAFGQYFFRGSKSCFLYAIGNLPEDILYLNFKHATGRDAFREF